MTLPGTVQRAPNSAHGFDSDTPLTARNCSDAKGMGFVFAIRYVGRGASVARGDLNAAEAQRILSSGLGLMAAQHPELAGWSPTPGLGTTFGQNAAAQATTIGFPAGVNLWLDLEGIAHTTAAEDVITYCNDWSSAVADAGFLPGVYVGANCILSGDQLYWRLVIKHFWKSGSTVPDIPHRGYLMVQHIVKGDAPFGPDIDRNLTTDDAFGNAAMMLAAS